jgi:hypothetical protein
LSKIKVTSKCEIYDGMSITFKAPCDCTAVDGLNVYYHDRPYQFSFRDTHGNDLAGIRNLFTAGSYVKVVLDTASGFAYIQNADSNAYLEARLDNVLKDETKALYGLGVDAVPDDVFSELNNLVKHSVGNLVIEKITESTAWTVPRVVEQRFKVYAVGGGGGGGNNAGTNKGGGGGGGGYVEVQWLTLPAGDVVDIVCGAGGASASDTGNGMDGGATLFGSYLTALGGKGGLSTGRGGDGGAGGGAGSGASKVDDATGGNGGIYGGGGGGGNGTVSGGGDGGTYGGGGGAGSYNGTGGAGGTHGGAGGTKTSSIAAGNGVRHCFSYYEHLNNEMSITGAAGGSYGGGGGYGGNGGIGGVTNNAGGGGGGGYGGNGGSGGSYSGGGGGNYGGNGGKGANGGGGGGGLFCAGSDASSKRGGAGGGIVAAATSGGAGGCYILYFREE